MIMNFHRATLFGGGRCTSQRNAKVAGGLHLKIFQKCLSNDTFKATNLARCSLSSHPTRSFSSGSYHSHSLPKLNENIPLIVGRKCQLSPTGSVPLSAICFGESLPGTVRNYHDYIGGNNNSNHRHRWKEGFGYIKLYSFASVILLTFTSGLNSDKETVPVLESFTDGKRKREKSFKELVRYFKSFYTVQAAKPLSEDAGGSTEEGGKVLGANGGSRRKNFNFIADVLEAVEDAVVCIEVKDHSTVNWFGIPQASSNGSGFIVKDDGLILTNAHVVAAQQQCSITVRMKDGRCFAGYVEDVDYESDLATVRVKARGLPTLKFGCSSETRVGEWVVAVGSPLNLSNTVTAGIVSSTRRGASELGIHANDINYIQTDAAITFGNSGGPLINLDCEAIGVNSMKVTAGISFAIPIDHVKKFLLRAESRRASGKSGTWRYMGLTILSLTDQIRRELEARTGISVAKQGVFVWQVVRGGPAYLAGIQPGDIILTINDQQMKSAAQVHEIVKTDDELVIKIQRGNQLFTVTVVPENVFR